VERVVLAFSKDETAEKIKIMLDGSGYEVCMVCHSKAELLRSIADIDEVLIIMGYKLPDGVADDVFEDLRENQKLMSIVKAEKQGEIYNQDIFVVTLPVNRQLLINSIETFVGIIERQKHRVKRTPEEERIIENAKAYLMENHMMTEKQAHRFIQKRSMDMGAKFIDTARQILNI
jgi:response regulator NasT